MREDPPATAPDPWQEPVRGGYASPDMLALSGADQLRTLLRGDAPQPPISHLTGMRLSQVGEGAATFTMPLSEWLCSPQGAISIGPLTMPADAAVACAIQTVLPPATPFTTTELSLRLLSPLHPGDEISAHGRLIQSRRTIALAEVTLVDSTQRLLAHGSSLCFVQGPVSVPTGGDVRAPAPGATDGTPDDEPPDPFLRPPRGEVLPQGIWESMSGLDVLLEQLAGRLPWPPISRLTGLVPSAASSGQVTFTMPATEWLCAPPRGRVQGGAVAMLAETALSAAIQTRMAAGTAIAPVDLKVNYLRPLAADGRPASARGQVVHAGRRVAVAGAEVVDADGRPVAVATGSAMVLPGRVASLRAVDA